MHGFENSRAHHGKCILYPEASIRACALKIGFDIAKIWSGRSNDNWTQNISDYFHVLKMRGK